MRTVKITFTEAMYAALTDRALQYGQAGQNGNGVPFIVRNAVRYYLNKNGHSASDLDRNDAEYLEYVRIAGRGLPGTRKGHFE